MRRVPGYLLLALGSLVLFIGLALAVQMLGHAAWWQVLLLAAAVVTGGLTLIRSGLRRRV